MTDSEKLDFILAELQGMKGELQGMKGNFQGVKGELQDMRRDLQEVKHKVEKIDLTIENEIRVNIQRVAEGHLDLSRKLNECIKLSSDIKAKQEMQDIYINMHENKLKTLAM